MNRMQSQRIIISRITEMDEISSSALGPEEVNSDSKIVNTTTTTLGVITGHNDSDDDIDVYAKTKTYDIDDFNNVKFKGKLEGLDKILTNRSMSRMRATDADRNPLINVPIDDQNFTISIKQFKGRSCFQKGQLMNIVDSNTDSLYEWGSALKWNKECFTLLNPQDEILAKCFDSSGCYNMNNDDGTTIVYGTCPMTTHDKPLEIFGSPKFYRWMQVKMNLKDDRFVIDLCSENFYTPLWYINGMNAKNIITINSVNNDTIVAWISKGKVMPGAEVDTNWHVKSRRGLDPALFICLSAILLRCTEKIEQAIEQQYNLRSRGLGLTRRTKSVINLPSYYSNNTPSPLSIDKAPRLPFRSKSMGSDSIAGHLWISRRNLSRSNSNPEVAPEKKEKNRGRAGASTVFQVVKGVVVLPFRSSTVDKIRHLQPDDNIWVGPDEIIRDRFLSKREETRSRIEEDHHLRLSLEDLRTCLQKGQRVHVKDATSNTPFTSGAVVKLRTESFVLQDIEGNRVAKSLEDQANQTSLILGTCPLFESDRLRKQKANSRTTAKYYPWLQVTITGSDMAIDLWTGHSYTSLWYCENVRRRGTLDVISSENDEKVGEFNTESFTGLDLKTNAGLDPAIFICIAVVVMRYRANQAQKRTNDDEARRNSSKVFRVVNGEVMVPFRAESMDFDESEIEEAAMVSALGSSANNVMMGIWVGPDDVIKERFLSKYLDGNTTEKQLLSLKSQTLKLAFEDDGLPEDDAKQEYVTNIEETGTYNIFPGCSSILWKVNSFFVRDCQGSDVAICMEDMKNLTSLVCGTSPLFPSDEPIERTENAVYYPWLQVRLEDEDLIIDMWSGHGYTALWYAEGILQTRGYYDILSAEFDTSVGKIRHNPVFDSIAGPGIDPSIFVCLNAIMYRFISNNTKKHDVGSELRRLTRSY